MSRWDIFRWRTLAGGRWCPVGTVQRSVSAAASVGAGRLPLADSTRAGRRECPPREGGEGKPLARSPASGKPPSRCATVRERRGEAPVSLAFSHALRAYKGKVVGLCPTTRKLFEKSLTKNFKLASLGHYSSHNTFSVSTSSCFSIPHSCAAFTASCRCSSTLRSCSSFKNSVFFPATKLPFPVRE